MIRAKRAAQQLSESIQRARRSVRLLARNFDAVWYSQQYPDVVSSSMLPFRHYRRFGWREGRSPRSDFDPMSYLSAYPDVAAAGIDPFLHYLRHGKGEGRLAGPFTARPPIGAARSSDSVEVPLHAAPNPLSRPLGILEHGGMVNDLARHLAFLGEHRALIAGARRRGTTFQVTSKGLSARLPDDTTAEINKVGDLHRLGPPIPEDPSVCFVILQHQASEATLACLASIRRLNSYRAARVVIVDNGSEKRHVDAVRVAVTDRVNEVLIALPSNVGFARGNNIGFRVARERFAPSFIICLNSDTMIDSRDFVERIQEVYRSFPYSILAPRLITSAGREADNPIADAVPSAFGWGVLEQTYARLEQEFNRTGIARFPTFDQRASRSKEVVNCVPQGAALAFSPIFLESIDVPFDESTFLYGEEFLLAELARNSGHSILYRGDISIVHTGGTSTSTLGLSTRAMLGYSNALKAANLCRVRATFAAEIGGDTISALDDSLIDIVTSDGRRHVLIDLGFAQLGFSGGSEYGRSVFLAICEAAVLYPGTQVWAAVNPALEVDPEIRAAATRASVHLLSVRGLEELVDLVNRDAFAAFFTPALVLLSGYEYLQSAPRGFDLSPGRTEVWGTVHDIRDLEFARAQERDPAWNDGTAVGRVAADDLYRMYLDIFTSEAPLRVVTDSHAVARAIRESIPESRRRPLHVLYPPQPQPGAGQPDPLVLSRVPSNFLLVVAGSRPEKNAARMIDGWLAALQDRTMLRPDTPTTLVVLGGIELEHSGKWADAIGKGKLLLLPFVDRPTYRAIVAAARGLLYVSLAEGFGYPPVEAMHHGVPSLVAEHAVAREIYGESVLYCNPFSTSSIKQGIVALVSNPPACSLLKEHASRIADRQTTDLRYLVEHLLA